VYKVQLRGEEEEEEEEEEDDDDDDKCTGHFCSTVGIIFHRGSSPTVGRFKDVVHMLTTFIV
jgi:hypothetical protein